jgi:hypothetical protein
MKRRDNREGHSTTSSTRQKRKTDTADETEKAASTAAYKTSKQNRKKIL